MLDVSYIGNRGSRLNHHCERVGVNANMNDPSVLALGTPVLQADIDSDLARSAGIPKPYPTFTGNVAQALRQWPQYQSIIWRGVPLGESQYHAFQAVLERRFTKGLQARVGYTFSRLKNNGAESAQGDNGINGGVQNPANPLERTLQRRRRAARPARGVHLGGARTARRDCSRKAVLGGWNLAGLLRYESGRPLNITMNNDLGGLLFNTQKRPNRTRVPTRLQRRATSIRSTTTTSNRDAWTDPGPLQFGNAPQRDPDVRGFATYGEDINIFKVFPRRRGEEPALRGAVRQYLRPHRLLRSEPELELPGVRHGQHPVQHASSREFWIPIRLLTDNRTIRTPPLQKDPEGLSRGGAILG